MTSPYTRVLGIDPVTKKPSAAVMAALTEGVQAPVQSVAGKTGAVSLVKGDVGLSNVNNTADADKPVSTLQAAAIGAKAPLAHTHPVTDIQTSSGTPSAATVLYGDGTWKVPPAGGGGGGQALALAQKSAAFTVADDGFDLYEVTADVPVNVELPAGVPTGLAKEIAWCGAGQPTIVAGAGASLLIPASSGPKVKEQYESIHVRARAASVITAPTQTNLLMRFRGDDLAGADGSAVSSWADSGPLGLPAAVQATSTAQPTVRANAGGSGHKGVSFDGSSDFLTLSGAALNVARNRSGLCVFVAMALTTAVTSGVRTILALSTGTGATSARALVGHRESSAGLPVIGGRRLDANSGQYITAAASLNTVQNYVHTARFNYAAAAAYQYINGSLNGSSTAYQTAGATSDTASMAGVIGANLAGNGEWLLGTILELLVYDGDDPTGSLRQNVHSYFAQRYTGFTVSDALPATTQWLVTNGVS